MDLLKFIYNLKRVDIIRGFTKLKMKPFKNYICTSEMKKKVIYFQR